MISLMLLLGETSGNAFTMDSRGRQRERQMTLGNQNKSRKGISKSIFGNIERWNHGKKGHMKKDNGAPKKKGDKRQEITYKAHVAGDVLQYALIISLENTSDYVQGYFGHVLLGGDEPCKIVGMGKVRITLNNEKKVDLNREVGR